MITFTKSRFLKNKFSGFVLFLMFFSIFSGIKQAHATHAAGADLTYTSLGGNQYLIEVTFYRDCAGVAEPASVPVSYKSISLNKDLSVTANKISGTGVEITVPCASSSSTCNGGSSTGLRKFVYQATVTLPGAAKDWVFSYHVCCRNCSITTIQNPCSSSSEIYVEATLNNVDGPNNSSPLFSNIPIAFVCMGQTFNYNHGVLDADGDSLAYEFITPKTSATTNVTFIAPANTTNPVSSSTPFTLNPITGQITFTPNQTQIGIMAIRIKEYRGSKLIGTVIRDMQVYTTPCLNNLPTASGINGTTAYSLTTCANQQVCFDINTVDADASQNVTITSNNGISGGTYTIIPGSRPTLRFCWTPDLTDIDLSPQTFIVTVRDNACPNNGIQTYSYNISVTGPDFYLASTNINCNGANNGIASATPIYPGPHTYFWSNGATTSSISGLSPGLYTVTLTNANGCTLSKSVSITQPATLSPTASQTNISCAGLCNGAIDVTVTGGTGAYTYAWSNGQTTQDLAGKCIGVYTVTVRDANNCTATHTTTLTNVSNIAANITSTNLLCRSINTGAANLTVSGGVTPYSFIWSNGATTQNINGIAAGTYTVTITDGNACVKSTSVTITQPSAVLSSSVSSLTSVSCYGGANGTINLSATGGTTPYSYQWSNGATTQDLNSLIAGSYTVTVTDANGCNATTASINITQPSGVLSSSTGSVSNVSCYGGINGLINLSVVGGTAPYTYNWSNGSTTQDLSNIASGTYSVTVTDARGCTDATIGILISQPPAALAASTASTNNVSCNGGSNGSINISVSGGTAPYSYNWSNGANTQDLSNITSGSYTVTVTDANGCTKVVSAINISQPIASLSSSVTSTGNVSCFGGNNGSINLNVIGGTAPYLYNWSNGATSQDITNVPAGSYAVTISDVNGCTSISSGISITQPSASLSSNASSTNNVSCFGGSTGTINLNVVGGTAPYSYNWNNGSTTQDLNNVPAGNYSVIVTDANSCTTTTVGITISQPAAALSSTNSHVNVLCRGNATGAISIIPSGGTSPYSFDWSNGSNSQNLSNISAGIYSVTITDDNGCTIVVSSITVTQPAAILAGTATTTGNVACNSGANGSVNLTVTGGTAPYTYNWSNAATTQDINGLFAGNYVVTISDANACTATSSSNVSQPAGALSSSISTSQNVSCYNGTNGAINLTVTGGTAPYTYNWSNGATSQDISGLSSGSYTVTVTDGNACINISTAIVAQPTASLSTSASSIDAVSCFGGSNGGINLSVLGGTTPYTYDWSNGAISQNLTGVLAGNYSVTVTDANGCKAQTPAIIISQPSGALSSSAASTNNVSCFGGTNGSINLTVTGGTMPYDYNWSTGDNTQDLANLSAGSYSVTVTDANGCSSQTAAITISQPPSALNSNASSSNNVSCFGGLNGSIGLSVNGGTAPYVYSWSNGAITQNLNNIPSGTYSVIVTDAQGCTTITSGVTITQPGASLSSSINSLNNVSCFGGNNGGIFLTVNGGTSPYSYNWSNGATSQNLGSVTTGTYSVSVTDANGCTTINSGLQITQPGAALSGSASSTTNISCYGGNNGGINITVSGGTTPYSYQWNNGVTTQNISNISSGNYSVTITDINGCSTLISSIAITEPAAVLNSLVSATNNVSCFGGVNGAVTLNVTGGTVPYIYNWSNGTHLQNLSNVPAGTYSVTIIDANGCTTSASAITISQPDGALTAAVSSTQNVSCYSGANGVIDITVTGGTSPYSYNWSNGAITQDVNGLAAGNYTVTITDDNGCTYNQYGTISQPTAALSASSTVSQNVSCFGGNNASISLTVNNGTSPYSYSWNNGSTTQNISNLLAGTYTVTVSDANGCTVAQTKTVTQPSAALSTSSSVSQNVSCYFGANGAINVSVSGGTSPYTYAWNNGSSSQSVIGLTAGTYTVIVTDINGCTASQSQTITQPDEALSASTIVTQNVSCFSGANGSIDLYVIGGTAPYSYNWSNGSTTQDISGIPSGTYNVSITDANGCTFSQNATINQPIAAISATINVTQNVSCNAGSNGSIDLTVNGGTSPYTYSWSNGITTQDISNLSSGVYTVSISDANGCTFSQNGIISQPASALSASSTVTGNISCFSGNNGSVDLTVTGGTTPYTYNWNTGAISQDLTGLSAGTYSVIVTDANGCTTLNSAIITQPAGALSASINVSSSVLCNGGNNGVIDLTVNGGTNPYSYNWSNGATTQDLNNLIAGTYTATITDANGCFSSVTGIIAQPALPLSASTSIAQNVSCFAGANGSINLTVVGGTMPYSYSWNNGATTQNITNLQSGTYTVTITDANGCIQTANGTVSQPSGSLSASTSVTQNVSCYPGANGAINLVVTNGTPPYSYTWSNGSTTQDVSGLISGTYLVNIVDANGCTQSASAYIAQPSGSLSASTSVTQNVSCNSGSNGSIDLSVIGGTAPYFYNWSNGTTTEDINNISAGTYTVSVTDAQGCTFIQTANVTQPAGSLSANATVTQNVSCNSGSNGSISLAVNGGTAPYSFIWSNGETTQNINNVSAGNYIVTVTDANGCTAEQAKTINQPSAVLAATLSASQNVSCFGGANGSISVSVNGGTAPYFYNWSNGAASQNISNLSSGTYTVTVTDANGCNTTLSKALSQPIASLSASSSANQNVSCFGGTNGSINLIVSGGTNPYAYNWSNGATTQNISSLSTGNYSVTITDANGCTAFQTQSISQPSAMLSLTSIADQNVSCFGGNNGSISLTINGGTLPYSFNWSNGATTQNLNSLSSGSYSVTVTDANGCTSNQTQNISQPGATLNASTVVNNQVSCFGGANGTINLTVDGGTAPYSYNWSNGSNTQDLNGLAAGTYTVTITDINGCTTIQSATVTQPSASLNVASSTLQNVSCNAGNNGAISIIVTGGTAPYSYNWSNGSITQNISGLISGTYSVIVTDANGCTTLENAVITQPSAGLTATSSASQQVSCFGGVNGSISLSVNGGTLPYTFVWSNGASTQNIYNLSAGTYSVTITDANGCSALQSQTVTQPSGALAATANVSQNVSCNGGNNASIVISVTGGTLPYAFTWSNGASSQNINNLTAGTYTVTITDANGCVTEQRQTVTEPFSGLSASSTVTGNISCFSGNNGSIDLSVTGGTSPYSYYWNTGATTEDLNSLSAGNYTVSITDANGCTTTNYALITQPAGSLSTSISLTQGVLCNGGNNGTINLSVTGGTTPYSYLWSNGATTQDINNLVAGVYTATITDANGCFASVTGTISEPSASLSASVSATQNVSCFAGANGSMDLTVSGGTAPYSFSWSNGATTQNITNLISGTYTVNITDANGCAYTQIGSITQPNASLSASTSVTQNVSCFSGANGSIDLSVTDGTAPYTFTWSNGATTEDIANLVAGTYSVSISDANGCTVSQTTIVTQPSGTLAATAAIGQNVLCFAGANGSIDLTVVGGTVPYIYNWSNGMNTEDIGGLAAGTYTVSITDSNGCTTSQSGTIIQPSDSLSATTTVTGNISCFSGNNGSIDLTVNGGTMPYTYSWNTGATSEDIINLSAGSYTVSIIDANGCTSVSSATIVQPAGALSTNIAINQQVSCFAGENGAVDLTVSGGTQPYTYNWSNGSTTEDIRNLSAGTYTVTIFDVNGCNASVSVNISEPSASLSASVNSNQNISCFGGVNGSIDIVAIDGTAPYTFNWSNGATTEDIINLSAGTYIVTITDANGCTYSTSVTLTQPSGALNASASATQNISCFGGSNGVINLTVTNGTSPYSFTWSNGSTTEDISGIAAGTYTVTVTDANGCIANTSITVSQPTAQLNATLNTNQNVSCFGGANGSVNLTVTDGTAPYTFNWSNGATTEDISNLSSGIYTVIVADANGCTQTASAIITQPVSALNASTNVTQNISCFSGANGSINLDINGGTSPYAFNWSNGETTQNISGLTAGNYSVSITDANGCSANSNATITQPSSGLAASINATQNVSCNAGTNGSIDLLINGGTAPYTFIWSNGATTEDLINLSAGTYNVTITDANGCTASGSANITQPANTINASANVSQTVSCFGGGNGVITLTVNGGTAPYYFNWSNGANTQDLTNVVEGVYTVTITDANGCSQLAAATMTQPSSALAVSGSGSTANCLSGITGNVNIDVNGGTAPFTFLWSNGSSTQNLINQGAGIYTVSVSDAKGCTANNTYAVTDISSFHANALGATTFCVGELATLVADSIPGASYQWYLNGAILGGATYNTFVTPAAGSYTVTVTNICGTFTSDPILITVNSIDNVSISSNVIICPGESTQLNASGGIDYLWTPENGLDYPTVPNPIASPQTTTQYTVTVTNAAGCKTTATVMVSVLCDTLIIPSGFSPNNDGINDGFEIVGIEHYSGNKIWIYNRWGNLIYKAHDYDNKWNGDSNVSGIYIGKKVPAGTYYYVLDLNNNTKPLSGYIILRY